MINVVCGNCGAKMRVPDNAAGKRGKCPKCAAIVPIPEVVTPPEPAPAAGGSPFEFESPAAPPPAAADEAFGSLGDAPPPPADDDVDEIEDRPRRPAAPESPGLSIASLVCGILGIPCCTCFLLPIAAIVLGFLGRSKGGGNMAMAGIILGIVGILLSCISWTLGLLGYLPGMPVPR